MALVRARKTGNSIAIVIPALVCYRGNIRHGDVFKLERDVLLPDVYSLMKINNKDEI